MSMLLISGSLSFKQFQFHINILLHHVNHLEQYISIAQHVVRLRYVGFLHTTVALYHLQEKSCCYHYQMPPHQIELN